MRQNCLVVCACARIWLAIATFVCAGAMLARAEDRTIDGTFNNLRFVTSGAAGQPMIRFGYGAQFPGDGTGSTIFTEPLRANPRVISNTISAQTGDVFNNRNLSDMTWLWGQFLDHDIDLSITDPAAGTAPIPTLPGDPLGPGPIPFTRSKFVLAPASSGLRREQVNEISSYIDASNVYGSNAVRAAALRADGGLGARLLGGDNRMMPLNTIGLPNDNPTPLPSAELFMAGDIRANENVGLSSLHTVFYREHNRLVDLIETQQPDLTSEQTYQLARKIVGAEMQAITYNEFLPAILGSHAPRAGDYSYDPTGPADITNSFAHAAYRFGHSMLASQLQLINSDGTSGGSIELSDAFFNPGFLTADPSRIDQLLRGAASQRAQEIDTLLVDDVRNALFGPPGAGGTDLATLNIQRGRDHGLPAYNFLRIAYDGAAIGNTLVGASDSFQFGAITDFSQITSDPVLAQKLEDLYGDVNNIDPWVGGLAEDHLEGASVGPLMAAIIGNQFTRLRDHDRLFYLSDDAGLYFTDEGGVRRLDPEIAAIIDLDNVTLSSIIQSNTDITNLQDNVFVVPEPSALALAAAGIFGAGWLARKRLRRG